jgi:hypothetical protein
MQPRLAALCCACAALWSQPAIAQQQARANPLDPRAETAATPYQSAFDGYRPLRDEKLRPWRDVNEEVARAGGHLGIFGGGAHSGHGAQAAPAGAKTGAAR